jgi:hypothetical protein
MTGSDVLPRVPPRRRCYFMPDRHYTGLRAVYDHQANDEAYYI